MDKCTNEKSLVVVQDNFLTKVKNFFARFFWSRKSDYDYVEVEEECNQDNSEKMEVESTEKQRKLYNFDEDNTEEWPGDSVSVADADDENNNNEIELNDSENQEEYDREVYSEAYIEKQKLEQKLLNYYESIKNGVQFE